MNRIVRHISRSAVVAIVILLAEASGRDSTTITQTFVSIVTGIVGVMVALVAVLRKVTAAFETTAWVGSTTVPSKVPAFC